MSNVTTQTTNQLSLPQLYWYEVNKELILNMTNKTSWNKILKGELIEEASKIFFNKDDFYKPVKVNRKGIKRKDKGHSLINKILLYPLGANHLHAFSAFNLTHHHRLKPSTLVRLSEYLMSSIPESDEECIRQIKAVCLEENWIDDQLNFWKSNLDEEGMKHHIQRYNTDVKNLRSMRWSTGYWMSYPNWYNQYNMFMDFGYNVPTVPSKKEDRKEKLRIKACKQRRYVYANWFETGHAKYKQLPGREQSKARNLSALNKQLNEMNKKDIETKVHFFMLNCHSCKLNCNR